MTEYTFKSRVDGSKLDINNPKDALEISIQLAQKVDCLEETVGTLKINLLQQKDINENVNNELIQQKDINGTIIKELARQKEIYNTSAHIWELRFDDQQKTWERRFTSLEKQLITTTRKITDIKQVLEDETVSETTRIAKAKMLYN